MTGTGGRPQKGFEEARRRAREAADRAVGDELDRIVAGADEVARAFAALKLQDPAAHRRLVGIVREAAERNESVGSLVERLRAVGDAGVRVAEIAGELTPAGLLRRLGKAGSGS